MALLGCNRNTEGMTYQIEGRALTVPANVPLAGADWSLFERAVVDGALQAEEEVASAESDAAGDFTWNFPEEAATASAGLHRHRVTSMSPVKSTPMDFCPMNPKALLWAFTPCAPCTSACSSTAPEDSSDVMAFNLGEDFPCLTAAPPISW